MIRVKNVKVKLNENLNDQTAKKLKLSKNDILNITIIKKSLDARKKENIHYVYELDVKLENENKIKFNNEVAKTPKETYIFPKIGNQKLKTNPIIIGAGPAGLFCAYLLAQNGYKPLIIERGEKVEDRINAVEKFWNTKKLNPNSNVQFGEGGAGAFSDGKLNTLVKDKEFRMKKVFEIFVKHGAPEEIKYENKPHIGTDKLRPTIQNIRNEIIKMGGTFKYNSCLTNIITNNNQIEKIIINDKEEIPCNLLVLAIGHSARDTFEMLYNQNIKIESKPFALGIRIQNPQNLINEAQYGKEKKLPNASYKLTYQTKEKRGVYTFCMCPGGYVINASSEPNKLVINGMSNYQRDTENANSAIIVTVNQNDFGTHPLDGIKFQRQIEEKAYKLGQGKIPTQLFKDYKQNKISQSFNTVNPIFKGEYTFQNINDIFPEYINKSLKEAIDYFGTKIKGFNNDDAIIAAPETRTSSPIRIVRDENMESNIKGIYPCAEGAGYAGGITSAAIDGIKIAETIAKQYSNKIGGNL